MAADAQWRDTLRVGARVRISRATALARMTGRLVRYDSAQIVVASPNSGDVTTVALRRGVRVHVSRGVYGAAKPRYWEGVAIGASLGLAATVGALTLADRAHPRTGSKRLFAELLLIGAVPVGSGLAGGRIAEAIAYRERWARVWP